MKDYNFYHKFKENRLSDLGIKNMGFGLNGLLYSNTDIENDMMIAAEAGYDAIEIPAVKLFRYLESGFTSQDINCLLQEYEIAISSISTNNSVDTLNSLKIDRLIIGIELFEEMAVESICNIIRLHGSSEIEDLSINDNIRYTACNIRKLCETGRNSGFRFQYEGAAWTPIHSIENYQMLIDEVAMNNFGIAVDFWHLWAGHGGTPDEIANLDNDSLLNVYITDGFRPDKGDIHTNDFLRRQSLPGDGDVPVAEWIDAVTSIGFSGFFSSSCFYNDYMNIDFRSFAAENLLRMKMYF